jgi:hypothetical protein
VTLTCVTSWLSTESGGNLLQRNSPRPLLRGLHRIYCPRTFCAAPACVSHVPASHCLFASPWCTRSFLSSLSAREVRKQGVQNRSSMQVGAVALLFATQAAAFRTSTSIAMAMPAPVDTSQFVGLPSCPRLGLGLAALGRPG